jgi:hypothetical protein
MNPFGNPIEECIKRKIAGIDCTEAESGMMKAHMDTVKPMSEESLVMAIYFPNEWDEWCEEVSRGDRPWTAARRKVNP